MDFGQLLHTAQKNETLNKGQGRYYSTKFEPPKKEKKAKELSSNIKKFLAKKEAEEKRKTEEEKKKREELLALRSQDKKATRRVNVMLKRTKSANQSVIQDAVDNNNTAVTLAGPMQPDEDDYGYVSQEASAYYNKMMEKYSKIPDEPKFNLTKKKVSTNLTSTKDRVKAALEKEKEEAMQPHRRKRKHKDKEHKEGDGEEEGINYERPQCDMPPPQPKPKPKPAPPPLNFAELLKIAEKKQFEPIIIEKKEKEEEKLLTKKQRREMEKERDYIQRKEARKEAEGRGSPPSVQKSNNNQIPKPADKFIKPSADRIPKLSGKKPAPASADGRIPKVNGPHPSAKANNNKPATSRDVPRKPSLPPNPERRDKPMLSSAKTLSSQSTSKASQRYQDEVRPNASLKDNKPKSLNTINGKSKDLNTKKPHSDEVPTRKYLPGDIRYKKSQDDIKPKKFPPDDLKQKQIPPGDLRAKQLNQKDLKRKQFPPPDVRRMEFPPKDARKKPLVGNKRRILDDDDSEYDSEMDDFIDDDEPEDDYSKYINEIFGYDKSRYKDMDDDVDNMESSFVQQMKEESISRKIGIMEDLEDMKKEEEEKKRKALMRKKIKL